MSIAIVSEKGLARITTTTNATPHKLFLFEASGVPTTASRIYLGSDNKYRILVDGSDFPLELLEDTNIKTSSVVYKFYAESKTVYAILAEIDEHNDCIISEPPVSAAVNAFVPDVNNIQLSGSGALSFGFFGGSAVVESGRGVGLVLNNATAPTSSINGLSYVVDIIKVVGDGSYVGSTPATYKEFKQEGIKCSRVQSIPLSTTAEVNFYDTSLQFKPNKTYTYIPFLYIVLGSGKYGGWRVTDGVSSVINNSTDRKIKDRDTDDLYEENKPSRIVAAQNSSAFQSMATKKFPKTNESNGVYYYSIMISAKTEIEGRAPDELANGFRSKLGGKLVEYGIINNYESSDDPNVLNSFQLSGVGAVSTEFKDYRLIIEGTLKMSLSNK